MGVFFSKLFIRSFTSFCRTFILSIILMELISFLLVIVSPIIVRFSKTLELVSFLFVIASQILVKLSRTLCRFSEFRFSASKTSVYRFWLSIRFLGIT